VLLHSANLYLIRNLRLKKYTIKKEILIDAPVERVFSALTSSDEIPQFYPLKSVESTWEVGGDVLYRGEVESAPFTDYGVIEQLDVPSVYRYRYWSDNHGTQRVAGNFISIEYQLTRADNGTRLTLFQSNIKSPDLYQLMETQVWDFLLGSLKKYLEART